MTTSGTNDIIRGREKLLVDLVSSSLILFSKTTKNANQQAYIQIK